MHLVRMIFLTIWKKNIGFNEVNTNRVWPAVPSGEQRILISIAWSTADRILLSCAMRNIAWQWHRTQLRYFQHGIVKRHWRVLVVDQIGFCKQIEQAEPHSTHCQHASNIPFISNNFVDYSKVFRNKCKSKYIILVNRGDHSMCEVSWSASIERMDVSKWRSLLLRFDLFEILTWWSILLLTNNADIGFRNTLVVFERSGIGVAAAEPLVRQEQG